MSIRITSSTKRLILWGAWPIVKPEISGLVLMCSSKGSISRLNIKVLEALAIGNILIIDWISFSMNGLFTVEGPIVPLLVVGALFVLGICLCFLVRVELLWYLV